MTFICICELHVRVVELTASFARGGCLFFLSDAIHGAFLMGAPSRQIKGGLIGVSLHSMYLYHLTIPRYIRRLGQFKRVRQIFRIPMTWHVASDFLRSLADVRHEDRLGHAGRFFVRLYSVER